MSRIELEFLTEDETTREICRQYWQVGDDNTFVQTATRIAETFGIPQHKLRPRVTAACHAFARDDCCPACGTPRLFTSRSDYTERRRYGSWRSSTCKDCRDTQEADARRESERQLAQQRAVLQQMLDSTPRLSSARLSFVEAVYVVSLLRVGGSEDLSFIAPCDSFTTPLSPTTDFDRDILDHLYQHSIVAIHPGSRAESLVFVNDAFTRFLPFEVHWTLPIPKEGPSPGRFLGEVEELLTSGNWPATWHAESEELHRVVALQECLQYMRVVMGEHGFEPRIGEKTLLALRKALANFSIGQVYNFLWRAARDAAAFYVREGTSKSHAANIVPGSIQRMAERALAEGWQVKAYRRDFRAPQSQLSQVLFTTALQLPDGGFTTAAPRETVGQEKADDGAASVDDQEDDQVTD